jgi:hypothetical protein
MGLEISIERKSEWEAYDKAWKEDEARREKEHDIHIKIDIPVPKTIIYGSRGTQYMFDYFLRKKDSKVLVDQTVLEFTLKDYLELCMKFEPYKSYVELIWNKVVDDEENNGETFDEELDEVYEKTAKKIFSVWNYDVGPYYGYQEEMGVVLQFLERRKEVEDIYASGDSCVIEMSY